MFGKGTKLWRPELSNIGDCEIGEDCTLHSHIWIGDGVKIGSRVRIEAFSFLPPGITIEDDVFIGPRVTFTNDKYPPSSKWGITMVCRGASLGAGVIVLPQIIIGEYAMIGAGSVVTKSVPPYEVWFGNPARCYRDMRETLHAAGL